MENYLKYALFFLTLSIILIASCSEETPIVPPETFIANAGSDQFVNVWDTVYLQGSMGKVSEELEYIWSFATKPQGSQTNLSDSSISSPSFVIDKIGRYVVKLVVMRGEQISKPDSVSFTATFQKSNQYFPNSVGSKWIYKVRDSLNQNDINVTVEIVGTTVLPGNDPVTIWHLSCSQLSTACIDDTVYVRIVGDTVITFSFWRNTLWEAGASYVFPLELGNGWNINFESTLVADKDSIVISAGKFDEAFRLYRERFWGLLTYSFNSNIWYVHNIGIIKMDLAEYLIAPTRLEKWELIWYHLAE